MYYIVFLFDGCCGVVFVFVCFFSLLSLLTVSAGHNCDPNTKVRLTLLGVSVRLPVG